MSPRSFRIVVLPGDGIGPEVVAQAVRVLEAVSAVSPDFDLKLESHDFGGCAIDLTGDPLPPATLKACEEADAILMGSIGGPKWGVDAQVRPEPGLLKLRKVLGLYANIRPANFASDALLAASPLKPDVVRGVDMIVVRELIGGLYFGARKERGVPPDEDTAWDTMVYSVPEVQRITRVAATIALATNPRSRSTRSTRRMCSLLKFDHHLVDSAAMLIVSNPRKLNGVIVTENLFGDIVIPGSLGLLPSASLAGAPSIPTPDFKPTLGLYEPIHGSAPDIAGQGIANPIGTILSAAMLLRYSLGLEKPAKAIEDAVRKVLDDPAAGGRGLRTADLRGKATTVEIGDCVVEVLKALIMMDDPEKSNLQAKGEPPLPEPSHPKSPTRAIFTRLACVFSLLLCLRVLQVHRSHPHPLGPQFHDVHGHDGAPPSGHGRHRHWHGKPPPRLSMEEREKLFLSVPNAESAMAASREYASHPHVAGSAQDFGDAIRMLETFRAEFQIPTPEEDPVYPAGSRESRKATLDLTSALRGSSKPTAWVDVYYPVMDTSLERSLEILGEDGDPVWTADLAEDGDPLDPDAHKYRDAVPTWHGASGDGDLIYANYGTRDDYAQLVAAGVNFTDKIVITRYGAILRGLQVKGAEELGAAGVLIYSDPRDDGYITVENGYEPYPAGPARNPTAVQRGSVAYINLYPGDPTTPGFPAYEDSNRTEGANSPKIPSLPISWANAECLLEEIDGIYVAQTPGSTKRTLSHSDLQHDGALPGHIRDEVVVLGGHRDAWVMGAADPISGVASFHEVIRGYGALLKTGWKPLRTILFASWDAEEYGLIGSTEWGEDFSSWIAEHAVAYLTSTAQQQARAGAQVSHPTVAGRSLWDARNDNGPLSVGDAEADPEFLVASEAAETRRLVAKSILPPLGSGSDFTVFLQRIGVASVYEGFSPTRSDAVYHYHSIYDTQRFQELYADPGFHRTTAVAKHIGLLLLRLTESIIVPLNTTQYVLELHDYLDEVEALVSELLLETTIDFSKLRNTIGDLTDASMELDAEKDVAEKDFKRLLSKLPKFPRRQGWHRCSGFARHLAVWIKRVLGVASHWRRAGLHIPAEWEEYLDAQFTGPHQHDGHPHLPRVPPIFKFIKAARRVTKVNKKLAAFEQGFISEEGIKGREWYRHTGVAPGRWTGYGATTFPALNEALSLDRDVAAAKQEAGRLNDLLTKLTQAMRA
ncbi:Isocitrate/isopropylmalate dehydrogenase-domain-containing protein [Mycena sp. CBHHK59/15]|nr:Isocitrate/isopropylmalate dehydrogenase-domain-containing protein [Mycena sp. CBHHK59/15]